jgi:imidazolonepropionase-like amidohydrolase
MSVHDELAMYVDAGLPPVGALRSATSVNARVFGLDKRAGTLLPGYDADMAVIRGNPLERIDDISQVTLTVRRGVRFEPEERLRAVQKTFDRTPEGAVTQDLLDYVNGLIPR